MFHNRFQYSIFFDFPKALQYPIGGLLMTQSAIQNFDKKHFIFQGHI